MTLTPFITRWTASSAAERANYQIFLFELCNALDVPRPDPTVADEADSAYVFEKAVPLPTGVTGGIDLHRRGYFVLEAKQGAALAALDGPATVEQVAAGFIDAPTERVAELLETLAGLGQATVERGAEPRFMVAS